MGEQNQYYIESHHEAIVSKEDWAKAEEILKMRASVRTDETTGNREQFTRRYSFSSMCECSYCGSKLTRRTRHSNSIYEKPVWQCMKASKYGVANCPKSKAIDEKILEETFLESFRLLAGNFNEVLDSVIYSVEEVFRDDKDYQKKKQLDKDISEIESRKSKMTDLLIDGTIDKETYDNKLSELTGKLHTRIEKRSQLSQNINNQKNVGKRMAELRKTLENEDSLDKFDRVVFDSVIEKVIVGGFDEEGKADPYKVIFILKGNKTRTIPNAKAHFKKMKKKGS